MLRAYYQLAKPGIIYGNAMTAAAGYFLAARGHIRPGVFVAMLVGICLVMASGCVVNNYIDRDIDRAMARTRKRALVTGRISGRSALIYAAILGIIGAGILLIGTNLITTLAAVIGWVIYVVLYAIGKRRSVHGTLIGSLAGAVPPLVGYLSVRDSVDAGAVIVFAALGLWQMPHFYAIAIFRAPEYAAAKIPVLPLRRGSVFVKQTIIAYVIAFTLVASLLTPFGYTGYVYSIVMLALGIWWLSRAIRGRRTTDDASWARSLFRLSLIVLTGFSVAITVGPLLP